jgi:hypothetical protein
MVVMKEEQVMFRFAKMMRWWRVSMAKPRPACRRVAAGIPGNCLGSPGDAAVIVFRETLDQDRALLQCLGRERRKPRQPKGLVQAGFAV